MNQCAYVRVERKKVNGMKKRKEKTSMTIKIYVSIL